MDLSQFPTFRVAALDLNGQWRGKRVPASYAEKLAKGAVRLPLSALNVDIWGADIEDSPLVFESGDADGILLPTERGPVPMPWLPHASALVPMTMRTEGGAPFDGDPRHALARVLDRYAARGWTVIAATEMEFTLVDDSTGALCPPRHPLTGRPLDGHAVLSLDELDAFDTFFTALYDACAAMGIPAQTAISEAGLGQFEVTLTHQDAMRAADDAVLFKTLVRGLARQHGMAATFMAKPYPDDSGNGMHVHFSVLDDGGRNVFDDGGPKGSETLHHAIGGCLAAMRASTLIFAPHGNSYDRMVPDAHAPTAICWGYENRTAAIRVPGGPAPARRIEHRVAGGDINPYLMLAAVLGAAMEGIEAQTVPPAPITGNAYEQDGPQLAGDWTSAISLFENDPLIARIFPAGLIRNMVMTKRQEMRRLEAIPATDRWQSWLERV
ncbi:glutamate--putrescine ligase [Salinihabitans flavidus]|uniref:Glutamate--putrescine ligase n=1 Tax=Salinihabitans flavidus TaxID=569882 RepID=A0A1H8R9C7_9RHOB|nr:glutamine synthetase family protein [Salinihabitans flavidus]SEO63179.1 glutamate--putrescine ligase [Salinihabitans flavidus]